MDWGVSVCVCLWLRVCVCWMPARTDVHEGWSKRLARTLTPLTCLRLVLGRSSRSHCMVTFSVVSSASAATDDDNNSADDDVRHYGKITFVDLAGSERLEQTESEGTMRTESGNINRSLFALGKVVSAISASNRAETATKCVRKLSWMRRAWLPACVCVVVGSRASGASDDGWLLVFVSAAGLRVPANRSDETSKPTRVSPRVPVCRCACENPHVRVGVYMELYLRMCRVAGSVRPCR